MFLTRSLIIRRSKCFTSCIFKTCSSRSVSSEPDFKKFLVANRQTVPCLPGDQFELMRRPPESLPGSRLLQVAILGVPNAGKSTLVNQLSGWNTNSVSKKVHTTRRTSKTVFIQNETQIVFLDTPGLVIPAEAKQYGLEPSFLVDPERALAQANLLLVLHDVSNKWTRSTLSPKILRLLHLYPEKKSILVLNKIDLLKEKRFLLRLTEKLSEGFIGGQPIQSSTKPISKTPRNERKNSQEEIPKVDAVTNTDSSAGNVQNLSEKEVAKLIEGKTGWHNFSQVFMVSALDGDGVTNIGDFLLQSAKPGRWIYNSSMVTDQNPQELMKSIIRGKLLDTLDKELPYSVTISIQYWDVDSSGTLHVRIGLDCKKKFTARLIVGTGGRNVIRLAKETEQDLRNIFRQEVRLQLDVSPHMDVD